MRYAINNNSRVQLVNITGDDIPSDVFHISDDIEPGWFIKENGDIVRPIERSVIVDANGKFRCFEQTNNEIIEANIYENV